MVIDAPNLGKKWVFPCDRWLDRGEDDGKIEIELEPCLNYDESLKLDERTKYQYTVVIKTNEKEVNSIDKEFATKVFILMANSSDSINLELAENHKFKPNSSEVFTVEAIDIDDINQIEVCYN